MKKRFLMGIAGASCSGKTTLARGLAASLGAPAMVLGMDSYYRDFSSTPVHDINVDVPESIDSERLIADVKKLAGGHRVEKPVYDYATHSRAPQGEWIEPRDFIIIEGLFALYWKELLDRLDAKVYVSADDDVCLARRVARDVAHRGRTAASVEEQYRTTVRPMFEEHVRPTGTRADIVVDGLKPQTELVETVLEFLRSHRNGI